MVFNYQAITTLDQTILWEMLFQALHVAPGKLPFKRDILTESTIARYAANWGRTGDEGIFAYCENQQVGAIWIRLWPDEKTAGYGYIRPEIPELSMAVMPEYRGQGIGTVLLEKMIDQCQKKYPGLSLSVSVSNPAYHLYTKFGFQPTLKQQDSLTMVKYF